MPHLRIAYMGDIVGSPGRAAAVRAAGILRKDHNADLIIANAENARHGSGLSPDNARQLLKAPIDGLTLGDHFLRDRKLKPLLEDPASPICRPKNLADTAPGTSHLLLTPEGFPPIVVVPLLGRTYMNLLANSPFETLDRFLADLPQRNALVIVEIHAEATSEKQALAWHALEHHTDPTRPRVVAVLGSHTHVQTADDRILDYSLAAITDLGMTGPHRSVIGRSIKATLKVFAEQDMTPLDVATDDPRAQGVILTIDTDSRRPTDIERFDIACS